MNKSAWNVITHINSYKTTFNTVHPSQKWLKLHIVLRASSPKEGGKIAVIIHDVI